MTPHVKTPGKKEILERRHWETFIMWAKSGPVTYTRLVGSVAAVRREGTGNIYIQGIKAITVE